jgi:uncharacterized protein YkwD
MDRKEVHLGEIYGCNDEDIGVKYVTRVLGHARRAVGLLVLALILLATRPAGAVNWWPASPQGAVGISRPTISQQFSLDFGESIGSVQMLLDGRSVEATWNDDGLVTYVPPEPLAAGLHQVRLTVLITSGRTDRNYEPIVSNFSFQVSEGAAQALPQPGPEELRALAYVNAYRKAAGQAPLKYSASLGAAAAGHARYLSANPAQAETEPHREQAGTPLFFGATVGERGRFYAYGGNVSEIINWTGRAEDAVDGWMETLYHRLPLIHPAHTEMGYGLAREGDLFVNVLEAGPGVALGGAVVWPYNGQVGVPTAWNGLESPDPFRLYPGVEGPVGYTITLTFGGRVRSLTLEQWSLTGPFGAVDAMAFSPTNDDELDDTVALIPAAPLEPGVRYAVSMSGQVDVGQGAQPYVRTWSFTTAAEPTPQMRSSRSIGVSRTVTGAGFSAGMRAFVGGLPVRNLQVGSPESFSFDLPVGLRGPGPHDLLLVTAGGQEARWEGYLKAGSSVPGGAAFTDRPMMVHGATLAQLAKVHADTGVVLVPATALAALGASPADVPEIGRTYWSWGGRQGDYTVGHAAATVDGQSWSLALPVQQIDGETYIEMEWVSRLLADPVRLVNGRVQIGLDDIRGHWAQPLIVQLVREGVVSGTGAGRFGPNDPLTRAAFVKMLVGARQLAPRPGDAGRFSDTGDHWVTAQGYIGAAVQAGFVVPSEYPDGRFEPDLPISREDMAVMVTRALGLDATARMRGLSLSLSDGAATIDGRIFTDAATWTRPGYVAVAVEQGIINGYAADGGSFTYGPFRQATRAEAVAMIVRMRNK